MTTTALKELAEKLLQKHGAVTVEPFTADDGRAFHCRRTVFSGQLTHRENAIWRNAMGVAAQSTLLNTELEHLVMDKPGKFAGNSRHVRIIRTVYEPA